MKKIYNFLLMLTVCMCGMGTANATKLFATYGTPAGNGSWDVESETYSWTAGWNNLMTIFTFSNGELANYQSLHLTTSGYTDTYRVCFMNGSTAVATIAFYSEGEKNLVFSERTETKDLDLSQITHISFGGNSGSGSIKLTKAYLEKPTEFVFDDSGKAYLYPTDLKATSWGLDSYDDETGIVVKSTTGYGGISFDFGAEGFDFSSISNIEISIDNGEGYTDIRDYANVTDLNGHTQYISATGGAYSLGSNIDSNVKTWNLGLNSKTGTMKINYVCFTVNLIHALEGHETNLGDLTYYQLNGSDWVQRTPNINLNQNNSTYFGSGSSDQKEYVDVSDFSQLRIYTTSNAPRAFFLKDMTGQGAGETVNGTLSDDGKYYYIDLNPIKESYGFARLIGVKSVNSWTPGYATALLVISETADVSYKMYGSGAMSSSAKAALADKAATLIDATKVSGSSLELTSANPNCIFVAKEGVLRNASNVAVDGVIANMVVTDGYPMEVPASTRATAASYSRKMANQYGTICLPFAVESSDAVKFYTLGEISGDVLTINEAATLPAGTPGIVEKVSGDAITCTGAGPLSNPVDVDGALKFYGSFEEKTIAAADYNGNIYAISNNKFVQAENQINLPAFRAFFAAESGEAKLRIAPNEDVTAINNVAGEATSRVVGVYGMDGAQRNSIQKGMNVIKMSNGSVRKVYVK